MSAQSAVLYSSPPSASQRYYHIISPNSRKSLNHCDVGRKQGHSEWLDENQQQKQQLSVNVRRRRQPLDLGNALWQKLRSFLLLLWYSKTKVNFFSLCRWRTARLSALQLLWFPPLPTSPSKTSFMPLWMWHAGNTMKESMNPNYTSPGTSTTLWDPVGGDAGSGETQRGPLHPQLTIYSWESKDKGSHVEVYWPSGY